MTNKLYTKSKILFIIIPLFVVNHYSFTKNDSLKVKVSGIIGISYEGYRVSTNPDTAQFFTARRPNDLVRIIFQPTISIGEFKLPFNFSFSPIRTNFGSPPFGFGNIPGFPKQSFKQWLANPMNNLALNPSYKWIEIPLGTQYIKYSELSTGDVGAFGYGINLTPGKFRFRFFNGINQQAYEPFVDAPSNTNFVGAYKRTLTMAQIGLEKSGKYFTGFNIVRGVDDTTSIDNPLTGNPATPKPQENFIVSFVTNFKTEKGWYGQTELGTTIATRDILTNVANPLLKNFSPFITTNLSSFRDHALMATFGKKSKNLDLGFTTKWLGAGYYSMGYPFVQNDRFDYTLNTRFNALKNKINVVASIGHRIGNLSDTASQTSQLIANANVFAQIDEHFSVNANYNNFGFQTTGLFRIRNVGHDLGFNPTYTWYNTNMSNLLSLTYNWSKYDETAYNNMSVTTNNSHTAMLMYVPSFFQKPNFNTDASIMYYQNETNPGDIKLSIWTYGVSVGQNFPKQKLNIKSQLQYNITTIKIFTPSKNLMLIFGADWNLAKRLTWNTSFSLNMFKYGNELSPPAALLGARYFENLLKTALVYKFGN